MSGDGEMKRYFVFTILLIVILCPEIRATVDTFYVSTNDIYMRSFDATFYLTARNMVKPNNLYYDNATGRVGQIYSSGYYDERMFSPIVTSDLDDEAVISSAVFQFYVSNDYSTTDFNITLCRGLWESDPPESATFEIGVGWNTNSGGVLNTSGMGTGWKQITLDSTQWINKTGTTRLVMVSDRTISSTEPTGDEHLQLYQANGGFPPFLIVTTTTGNAPDSLLTDHQVTPGILPDTLPPYFMCRYQGANTSDSVWWQVGTAVNDSDMWNSGWKNIDPVYAGDMIDSVLYVGSDLQGGVWYKIRAKTKATSGTVSDWSDPDSFRCVSGKRVYVNLVIDTESGNANISTSSLHPTIYFDTWHSPDGGAYEVFQKTWRLTKTDYDGNMPCWNWCVIQGEPYDSADGSWTDHWEAARCIYDTLTNLWANQVWADSGFQDVIGTHFHWYDWCGSAWQWGGTCTGDNDLFDTTEMKRYMANVVWHGNDASGLLIHRGGWNREHTPLHYFLKNWILFDWNNVDGGHISWTNPSSPTDDTLFRPYNPSDTNWKVDAEVHQDRWINGIVEGVDPAGEVFDVAWNCAVNEGYSVLALYDHNYDNSGDIKSHFEVYYDSLVNHQNLTAIPFIFCNVQEAMRWSHGWTDSVSPSFMFTQYGDSMEVKLSEKIFNPHPFGIILDTSVTGGTNIFNGSSGESADDGDENNTGGVVTGDNYVEINWRVNGRWGAFRIPNVTIGQGVTINSAHLSFYNYSTSWDHCVDSIACHDVDSATVLEAGGISEDISERWANATTAKIYWNLHPMYEYPNRQNTDDVSSLVQEIVDRDGWESGNAMMFLFKVLAITDGDTGDCEPWSWDFDNDAECNNDCGCSLYVNYTISTARPDTFCFIEFNEHNDSTWWYSTVTYPGKAKFAVIDTCGNVAMDSTTPSLDKFGIQEIYTNGVLMRIYENIIKCIYIGNP